MKQESAFQNYFISLAQKITYLNLQYARSCPCFRDNMEGHIRVYMKTQLGIKIKLLNVSVDVFIYFHVLEAPLIHVELFFSRTNCFSVYMN